MRNRKDECVGRKGVWCCQNVSLLLFGDMMTLRKGWRRILQLAFFSPLFFLRGRRRMGGNKEKAIKFNLFFLVYAPALA